MPRLKSHDRRGTEVLVLSRAEVDSLLDVDSIIEAVAGAFVSLSEGRASVPPRVAAFAPGGFLAAMPGYVEDVLEAKLVTVFGANHERGIPSHQALIALFDPATGTPLALMDGTRITAARTAAGSAVSTRALAREDASVLAVIGAGVQGRAHIECVGRVRRFDEIRIASRDSDHASEVAADLGVTSVGSFEEAVRGADVICLCTDSTIPVIDRGWVSPGAHVTSVGANPEGGELDAGTRDAGLLVVESRVAFEPPPAGAFELRGLDPSAAVEIGEVLNGTREGRTSADQITVYKSMGHAVEDAVAARMIYDSATQHGVGTEVKL